MRDSVTAHPATSDAQYVRTTSAPARRMPMSDSRIAASRSIPPVLRGRGDHRVLPRDLVRSDRNRGPVGGLTQNVQVGHCRLDHHHVGALGDVEVYLAHRLAAIGAVLLIRTTVALQ